VKRRAFITLLGGAAAAWPLATRAQQQAIPIVGFLGSTPAGPYAAIVAAVRQGLKETGFVEGQNLAIEYRWADNQLDRLPALAADLVSRKIAVIVTSGSVPPALAATHLRRWHNERSARCSSIPDHSFEPGPNNSWGWRRAMLSLQSTRVVITPWPGASWATPPASPKPIVSRASMREKFSKARSQAIYRSYSRRPSSLSSTSRLQEHSTSRRRLDYSPSQTSPDEPASRGSSASPASTAP
jgi:hypothetical protein